MGLSYRTRAISGRDFYCFKGLITLLFHDVKNKKKDHLFYENKQGVAYITERPEMARVRYRYLE